jgi:DNA-binding HxlR family transcriptional regulator
MTDRRQLQRHMSRLGPTAPVEREIRAGSRVLSVFENPLNTRILRAHADGPLRFSALQEKIGSSAPTTLRVAVGGLIEAGALAKLPASGSGYGAATVLSPAGEEMLAVADAVAGWLGRCPTGPIALESEEAREAVKALAGGWSSRLIRALAGGPRTLTELHRVIPDVSYPSLERRVSWMRRIGQIEAVEREGRGTPYDVTDWLRRAIGPLSAAGRCERRHLASESGPITDIEVEASFLLVLPLVPLRNSSRGSCMLAVHTGPSGSDAEQFPLSGVTVEVGGSSVISCTTAVNQEPGTWAVGSPETWLDAVIDAQIEDFRIGGADPQLALDLVTGLHFALFCD